MTFDLPKPHQLAELRALWKEAFGDSDEFIDAFEKTAFSADRCRCATESGKTVAALYWFDCTYSGGRVAYLYAVATSKAHQGRGICTALMKNTHEHLKKLGYSYSVLVPGEPKLFDFYKKMGYEVCCHVKSFCAKASEKNTEIRQISACEYKKLRRIYLPEGSVLQENENLAFLETQASFFTGNGFLLTARKNRDSLCGLELLGNVAHACEILKSLGCAEGHFRAPNGDTPFAMCLSLNEKAVLPPAYFGLAFD